MNTIMEFLKEEWKAISIGACAVFFVGAFAFAVQDGRISFPILKRNQVISGSSAPRESEALVSEQEQEAISLPASSSENIVVVDQPAGRAIIVASVSMPQEGWVVVRELSTRGEEGNILGAARRNAGNHREVLIDLLRGTEPSRSYRVALHADDGDRMFAKISDLPLSDASGAPLVRDFKALTPASPAGN